MHSCNLVHKKCGDFVKWLEQDAIKNPTGGPDLKYVIWCSQCQTYFGYAVDKESTLKSILLDEIYNNIFDLGFEIVPDKKKMKK